MFDWMVNGRDIVVDGQIIHEDMGANRTADALNSLGSRTRRGNLWTVSSVRGVIHNPIYAGKIQWFQREKKVLMVDGQRVTKRPFSPKHIVTEGRHEPIVPQELWDAAQLATSGRNHTSQKKGRPMLNPLAGIVKCSECGHTMVRTPMYGHLAGVDYLKCPTPRCATSACPLSDVEHMILDTLVSWIESAQKAAPRPSAGSPVQDRAQELRAEAQAHVDELEKRRDRLMDLLESGVYDVATYGQRMALLQKDLDAARAALDAVPAYVPTAEERLVELLPQLEHVVQAYFAAQSPDEKNKLLRSVIQYAVYHKTHVCTRSQNPADFVTLDVFPVL